MPPQGRMVKPVPPGQKVPGPGQKVPGPGQKMPGLGHLKQEQYSQAETWKVPALIPAMQCRGEKVRAAKETAACG